MEQARVQTSGADLTTRITGWSEKLSYLLVCFILLLLPFERFSLPLSLKIVDLALVLTTGVGILIHSLGRKGFHIPLAIPGWIILAASFLATMTGLMSMNSIIAIFQEIYIFACFVVLVNLLIALPPSMKHQLLGFWSIVAVIEATMLLMGMLNIGPSMFYTSPDTGRALTVGEFNRGYGTFFNPNAAAAYLSVSFFVLLGTNWKYWLRAILGAYILAGIVATGSMGAILSTAISLVILLVAMIVMGQPRRSLLAGGILALIAAALIILIIPALPLNSSLQIPKSTNMTGVLALTFGRLAHSIGDRMDIINAFMPVYQKFPLGAGPNTSVLFLKTMHTDYLAFLFERGPLGLFGWLVLVIGTLLVPFRHTNGLKDSRVRWRTLALWGGFLASMINAFTHEVSHFRYLWVLLAFLYAAYDVVARRQDSPGESGVKTG